MLKGGCPRVSDRAMLTGILFVPAQCENCFHRSWGAAWA